MKQVDTDIFKNVLMQDPLVFILFKFTYEFIQSINPWSYYIKTKLYLVLLSIQPFSFILNKYVILIIIIIILAIIITLNDYFIEVWYKC
jgi:hypothetical protein